MEHGLELLTRFDPEIVGGAKVMVRPTAASVKPDGRTVLEVTEASVEAVEVQREREGTKQIW